MSDRAKALTAEFIGTFALVIEGAGLGDHGGPHGHVPSRSTRWQGRPGRNRSCHGCVLMAMVYAFGSMSGGHFNPAVSFAGWMQGSLKAPLMAYIGVQVVGALAAALILADFRSG